MNIRIFLTTLTIATIGFFLAFNPIYAATPTPKATSSAIADAEIEREKQITKELSLNMPDQTEDPNYPITFVDPGKFGVDITVDDKTTTKAPNPFLLPNLAIGEHKIIFKFKTKDGVVRVLTKKLLVTPKPPQFDQTLKTEVVKPNSVAIKGTALPQATIMIVVNSEKTYKITSTTDGKWEFIIPDPTEGVNNILAFAIKSGIVSTASKTFTVVYKLNPSAVTTVDGTVKGNKIFDMAQTIIANIDANRRDKPTIFYGVIGAAVVGILILIDVRLRKKAAKNRDEKTIAALFGTLQKDGGTIMDAIQSVTDTVMKKKTKEVVEEKPQPPAKIKKALADLKDELSEEEESPEIEEEPVTEEETPIPQTEEKVEVQVPEEKKSVDTTNANSVETSAPTASKVKAEKANTKKATPQKTKPTKPVAKSAPLVIDDVEDNASEIVEDTEEPEKKVLTKEEFLKQFQKGNEQDE